MVQAGLGCHLTLRSVADLLQRTGVHFVALQGIGDASDVHLRVAHRRIDENHAVPRILAMLLEK